MSPVPEFRIGRKILTFRSFRHSVVEARRAHTITLNAGVKPGGPWIEYVHENYSKQAVS